MPQIIHPPDPWGGPRFALDVFGALIGAWDRIQSLQEKKEARDLVREAKALEILLKAMEMPEEWHLQFAPQINALAEKANLPPIVVGGKVYRPPKTELEQRAAEIEAQKANIFKSALEGLKLTPEEQRRIGLGALTGDILIGEKAKKMEAETEHLRKTTEIAARREEREEKMFPLEQQMREAQIGLTKAKEQLTRAQTIMLGAKMTEDPNTGAKVYHSTWDEKVRDPQTGEEKSTGRVLEGFVVFDKKGNLMSQVPLREVPIKSDVYTFERKHINSVLQQFVKEKKRDIDWTDEKEVKSLASRYSHFGNVILRRGGTEKKPLFWLEVQSKQSGMTYPVGPVFEEWEAGEEQKRSTFLDVLKSLTESLTRLSESEPE